MDGRPVWISSDPLAMPVTEVAGPYDGLPVRLVGDPLAGQPIRQGAADLYASTPVWVAEGPSLFDRWSPTDLGASLIAWWTAESLANGAVASWPDSVLALAPAQASGPAQPIRSASSFNAYPGVTFDGTDDNLGVESTVGLPLAATPCMVWVLATPTSGGTRVMMRYGSATTFRGLDRGGGVVRASDGAATAVSSVPWASDIPAIVMGQFEAAAVSVWHNGVQTGTAGATLNTSGGRTRIGANSAVAAAAFWTGVISEVAITGSLSVSDRQKMEGFLAWRRGLASVLALDHPYRTVPP